MVRASTLLLILGAVLAANPVLAARRHAKSIKRLHHAKTDANQLLRVITPVSGRTVPAHPFVNVIVRFATGGDLAADPRSFRAHLGSANITRLFTPIVENGAVVGTRAFVGATFLGRERRYHHLRLEVRGGGRGRGGTHDVDHVRFRAQSAPDRAPTARALVSGDVIVPGVPLHFDATESADPDLDPLTYRWDFGDGTTSSDPRPVHVFASNVADATVRLTVSDGQLDASDRLALLALPSPDPGRTPGVLAITAPGLEFGGVVPGAGATLTFTVRNADPSPTSQLKVRLAQCTYDWSTSGCQSGGPFALGTSALDLGPTQSAAVSVGFAPGVVGHASGQITLVASASNQNELHLLTHGYGGAAPGTGPLPISEPLLSSTDSEPIQTTLATGALVVTDGMVRSCAVAGGGPGTGDACLVDADCAANSGTCPTTGTCSGGSRDGQACATPGDCPAGNCSAAVPFDPIDLAGDGAGGVYLLSDDSYTDPDPNDPANIGGTLLHLQLDGAGNRTGAAIVARTPMLTTQIASDARAPAAGGSIYVAWFQPVTLASKCLRSAVEQLVAIRESDGSRTVILPRIDAVEGLDGCADEYEPADDIEVARDGSQLFIALPGGIYRILPGPLLMTPDEASSLFAVHPDGSIIVVTAEDQGSTGLIHAYRISADQAATGAPHLNELTPCATMSVPNDGGVTTPLSLAIDPVTAGSGDGTIVVSFSSASGGPPPASIANVQGTFAITSPAGSDTCAVVGLVNLDALDDAAF